MSENFGKRFLPGKQINSGTVNGLKKKVHYGYFLTAFFLIIIAISGIYVIYRPIRAPRASYTDAPISRNFDVNYFQCNVTIEMDGSITIRYLINFTNLDPNAPIRVVDIGFPNDKFDLDGINATITDESGTHILKNIPESDPQWSKYTDCIQRSSVLDIGAEIWLCGHEIYYGKSAQLYVEGNNPEMLYRDYENSSMASLVFSPTWFSPDYCPTFDYFEMNFIFPPTVNVSAPGITKWYYKEPDKIFWENNLMIWRYNMTDAPMKQYTFGLAFPADAIDYNPPAAPNPELMRTILSVIFWIGVGGIIAGSAYFIYRGIKGSKQYYPPKKGKNRQDNTCCFMLACFIYLLFFIWLFDETIMWLSVYIFVVFTGFGLIAYLIYKAVVKFRLKYIPPEVLMETAGVKKGLTVVEAAIIMNVPLKKVLFLILFNLIRLGYIKIESTDPLKLKILNPNYKSDRNLRYYHKRFLDAVKNSEPQTPEFEEAMKDLLVRLIRYTSRKMKGFDPQLTAKYYESLVNKAWDVIRNMPKDIDLEKIETEFEWLVLDDKFNEKYPRMFSGYRIYRPAYWYPYYGYYYYPYGHSVYLHPHSRTVSGSGRSGSSGSGGAGPSAAPLTLVGFADAIVRGIEGFANGAVKNFTDLANGVISTVRPTPTSSGRGGTYTGGGCACACACACAGCACACAGGGR